ncbi:hypothetical protein, partial [Aeromonas bestiarum]
RAFLLPDIQAPGCNGQVMLAFCLSLICSFLPRSVPDGCAIQRDISPTMSFAGANEGWDVGSAQYPLNLGFQLGLMCTRLLCYSLR